MAIRVTCACGQTIEASDEHAGREYMCTSCGAFVTIPGTAAAEGPVDPSEEAPLPSAAPPAFEDEKADVPVAVPVDASGIRKGGKVVASADVTFHKIRARPLRRHGLYRGRGRVEVWSDGVAVYGRRVLSVGARAGIACGLVVGSLVLSAGYLVLGIIPIYLLVEYVFLKRHDIFIPTWALKGFTVRPKGRWIGLEFDGWPGCSPLVFRAKNWDEMYRALRHVAPDRDVSPEHSPTIRRATK